MRTTACLAGPKIIVLCLLRRLYHPTPLLGPQELQYCISNLLHLQKQLPLATEQKLGGIKPENVTGWQVSEKLRVLFVF